MEQEIEVWIGLDVDKRDHHATVLDGAGGPLFDRACRNEEAALEQLFEDAGPRAALVIDQPGSIGTLAVALSRRRGIPVAYVPGLVMRGPRSCTPEKRRPTGATAS